MPRKKNNLWYVNIDSQKRVHLTEVKIRIFLFIKKKRFFAKAPIVS